MCGRLSLHDPQAVQELARELDVQQNMELAGLQARYNVAPTQQLPVIRYEKNGRILQTMEWGWRTHKAVREGQTTRHINAKSETVFQLPTFRKAAREQRCIIAVNGYYEWRRDPQDRPLEPHYIHARQHAWLAMAGIYTQQEDVQACVLLTRAPNNRLAMIHHRMPCVLDQQSICAWLDAKTTEQALQALHPVDDDYLVEHVVSDKVNGVRAEGMELIREIPLPPQQMDWILG